MCQDTSELKKIQSPLSSDVPSHKWTRKKNFQSSKSSTQVTIQ